MKALKFSSLTLTASLLISGLSMPEAKAEKGACPYVGNGTVCLNVQRNLIDRSRVVGVKMQRLKVGDPQELGICNFSASNQSNGYNSRSPLSFYLPTP